MSQTLTASPSAVARRLPSRAEGDATDMNLQAAERPEGVPRPYVQMMAVWS